LVDALETAGIPAFGPTKAAAQIEASKVFAKTLMQKYAIPTAAFRCFEDAGSALVYLRGQSVWPQVVKADGLALGKGVFICAGPEAAAAAVKSLMEDKLFGQSGARVVAEEYLKGPEVSVLAFCDGERVAPMVSSMDHKRALDGDEGPNTGGMGAVAPNPRYTPAVAERCMREIYLPTLKALAAEGRPFKGCLYFGLMLTAGGPKVIEYNCRFGDPEAQVVLPLLEGDLLQIMLACTEGRLMPDKVRFSNRSAACVVLVSAGYPGGCRTGYAIGGLNAAGGLEGVTVTHAGTRREGGAFLSAGGRVLNVTATAPTLEQAVKSAYTAARGLTFEGMRCRTDIGKAALEGM
jgi:phosphoribosylamine--glycine ligase